ARAGGLDGLREIRLGGLPDRLLAAPHRSVPLAARGDGAAVLRLGAVEVCRGRFADVRRPPLGEPSAGRGPARASGPAAAVRRDVLSVGGRVWLRGNGALERRPGREALQVSAVAR